MDDSVIEKTWEQPWSTEEMRAHCSNWNLAGDAGLLKHLQEFSQNLLQKTHTTEVALDSLLEDMRNTSVDVQNATNALLMLSNNQFVENRVYDDCEEKDEMEVKPDKDSNKPIENISEASLIAKAAEAILLGMSVIDTKFECVEVPASDSEGEEEMENGDSRAAADKKSFALVLEPKNPYTCRPLPYLIGSKEFMEDDRIGLVDEEEEDEEDEEEEDEIPVSMGQDLVAQGTGNDSGSSLAADIAEEGLFVDEDEVDERRDSKVLTKQNWESTSSNVSDGMDVENDGIRKKRKKEGSSGENISPSIGSAEEEEEQDIFGKESSSDDDFLGGADTLPSLSVKKQPNQTAFAEELAAKLGAVDPKKVAKPKKKKKKEAESKTENPKPKTKSKTPSISSDNLFGPPKDDWIAEDDADSIFVNPYGMFSGGRGLFDDLNDPILDVKPSNFSSSSVPPNLSDKPPPLKKEKDPSPFGENDDIFGENKSDDERDMFADILVKMKPPDKSKTLEQKTQDSPKRKLTVSGKKVLPSSNSLFDDDREDLLDEVPNTKEERTSPFAESKKEKKRNAVVPKKDDLLQGRVKEEGKDAKPEKKLVAGARSLYADGIDPFALGKKVVKELHERKKFEEEIEDDDDLFSNAKASSQTITSKVADKVVKSAPNKESLKEPKSSSRDLFDDVGDGDDLFTSVISKGGKDLAANDSDAFFGDDLFNPKKTGTSVITSDKASEKDKNLNSKKGGSDFASKGLFGDSGSDDDDIFSCSSSLGSRSSSSKVIPSKSTKIFSDPASSLFEDNYDQQADIFSGALRKSSISDKKDSDDLFKDVGEVNIQSSLFNEKKEMISDSKKFDQNVPTTDNFFNKEDDIFSESVTNVDSSKKIKSVSEGLLVPDDNVIEESISTNKLNAAKHKRIDILSDDLHSENDVFSSPKELDIDDIFGKSDGKLDFAINKNEVSGTEKIDDFISTKVAADKDELVAVKSDEAKVFKDLFEESKEIEDDDIFSSKKLSKDISRPETTSPAVVASKPLPPTKRSLSKDLFAEFGSDDDSSTVFSNIKEENKVDSLLSDPLCKDGDLFSSQKPKVASKKVLHTAKEKSPELFPESEKKATPNVSKDNVRVVSKENAKKMGKVDLEEEKKSRVLPPALASNTRKSPPRTLNLDKVIPSPKLGGNFSDANDDFFGSSVADDDRIVEAWMKGQPPPLRDSKVENTMEDLPNYHLDGYAATKSDVHKEDDSSYFGDIPAGSLLHSHGKERARIQNRRRPPSRKIRKTQTAAANVDHLHRLEEDGLNKILDASPVAPGELPPSTKDSTEEDGGSQGTAEEWSTPEAALTSPSSLSVVNPPPRSNPLSPSTDEEQDFFDVLPVGRYPPPMEPPDASPFSDALNSNVPVGVGDDLWDKDNGGLFANVDDIMGKKGSYAIWSSPTSEPDLPAGIGGGVLSDNLFGEISKSSPPKSSLGELSAKGVDKVVDDDDRMFFTASANLTEGAANEGNNGAVKKKEAIKKEGNVSGKKEGKEISRKRAEVADGIKDDGQFESKPKSDLFSKRFGESEGDFDDLFLGQDDLFGTSKMSSSLASEKAFVGIAGSKNLGKSLSKLPPKAKGSLFEDEEDDTEDLFSPRPSKSGPVLSNTSKRISANKNGSEKKTSRISSSTTKKKASNPGDSLFEDPLMVLKRKD